MKHRVKTSPSCIIFLYVFLICLTNLTSDLPARGERGTNTPEFYHAHGAKSGPVPCPKCTFCMPGHIDHEENEEGDPAQCTKRLLRQRPKRCKCSVAVASVLHAHCMLSSKGPRLDEALHQQPEIP